MSKAHSSLLGQVPAGSFSFYERINKLLQTSGLIRMRAAVAYARWDGLGLISKDIEAFLTTGGDLQTIYGVANGVTTPDALLYALYLQDLYKKHSYAGAIEDKYANSTFHAKFFDFQFRDETVIIIGSANLTGGGLLRNAELGVEIKALAGDPLLKDVDVAWKTMRAMSKKVTLPLVRELKSKIELGSEQDPGEGRPDPKKPWLRTTAKRNPKPLFARILGVSGKARRSKIFSKLDALTTRPKRLYLQIMKYETGGHDGGGPGYQVQLPVGTLATFFGIGENEARQVMLRFPEDEFKATLTHFENNTHRVRMLPIRDIPRPAIVIFERIGVDDYRCSIVSTSRYASLLRRKCTEQAREGARRWGLE